MMLLRTSARAPECALRTSRLLGWLVSLFVLVACSDDKPRREADQLELFPRDQKLEVELTLAAEDWQALAAEGRSLNDVFSGCADPAFEYTKFKAKVRIGNRTFDEVSVRKKGFLGSLSKAKPSLRIDLDTYVADQELSGTSAITLNNSESDASFTRQCMAYEAFARAGVPAPRCGFASVTVNGELIGTYVNVEPIKKPFLKRQLGENKGDLYEGVVADFRSDMLGNFEKKTNESEPQGAELLALATALTLPEEELLTQVESLVNVDAFLRFWATESLIGHWDGYAGDLNNFYLYVAPDSGQIQFIPWGTDATFRDTHPFLPSPSLPKSVYAWARLPNKLYAIEATRERYRAQLRELLDTQWNEEALLAEVDRLAALVGSEASDEALEAQREFIRTRREVLLAELDGPAPLWSVPERALSDCRPDAISDIRASFVTTWGDLENTTALTGNSLESVVSPATPLFTLAGAGESTLPAASGKALRITQGLLTGGYVVLQLQLGRPMLAPGVLPLHGFETFGVLLMGTPPDLQTIGYVGAGSITFDEVGTEPGDAVSGHLEGQLVGLAPPPASE